jgi:hypothetical protein
MVRVILNSTQIALDVGRDAREAAGDLLRGVKPRWFACQAHLSCCRPVQSDPAPYAVRARNEVLNPAPPKKDLL